VRNNVGLLSDSLRISRTHRSIAASVRSVDDDVAFVENGG